MRVQAVNPALIQRLSTRLFFVVNKVTPACSKPGVCSCSLSRVLGFQGFSCLAAHLVGNALSVCYTHSICWSAQAETAL